jgi:hypothetical protein
VLAKSQKICKSLFNRYLTLFLRGEREREGGGRRRREEGKGGEKGKRGEEKAGRRRGEGEERRERKDRWR